MAHSNILRVDDVERKLRKFGRKDVGIIVELHVALLRESLQSGRLSQSALACRRSHSVRGWSASLA